LVAVAACAKQKPPRLQPRCIVTLRAPAFDVDAAKAPACSATVLAPDETSYAAVIAAMDTAAKAGFVDFGIGDVVSKLPPPESKLLATRTTNEGMLIGRLDPMTSAPIVVLARSGDVSVGGVVVGRTTDANLTDEVRLRLSMATGSGGASTVVISADASLTYGAVYRVARAADDLGYTSFLFGLKN
jgi:biopolymer transport protein ExbD